MALIETEVGKIASEEVEPMAAMIIGRLFARVEAATDPDSKESAFNSLWWAVNALNSLSVAIGTATHFSIASNNHVCWTAQMIRDQLGIDPMTEPMWKYR